MAGKKSFVKEHKENLLREVCNYGANTTYSGCFHIWG